MIKQNVRKIAAIILLGSAMLMLMPITSMAESNTSQEEMGITPYMTYIVDWKNGLGISGGTATVDCWVKGQYGDATKAKVIAELQLKSGDNWLPVAIWTDTQNAYRASVYETKTVTEGNTYRVKATYTVWEGSQSETHISIGDEMTA